MEPTELSGATPRHPTAARQDYLFGFVRSAKLSWLQDFTFGVCLSECTRVLVFLPKCLLAIWLFYQCSALS